MLKYKNKAQVMIDGMKYHRHNLYNAYNTDSEC